MKKDKTLIIENTYYSLLLYIFSDSDWREKDYYIVRGRVSDLFIERFIQLVNKVYVFDSFPTLNYKMPLKSIKQRLQFLDLIKRYRYVLGNICELKIPLSRDKIWTQIDDGEYTYIQLMQGYRPKIRHFKFKNSYVFRKLFKVDYVFNYVSATYLLPNSSRYETKIDYVHEKIDFAKKYACLSSQEKNVILSLFGLNISLDNGNNILLMQPLFDDGLVPSVDDEIQVYKIIMERLKIDQNNWLFKPHPASKVDYSKFLPLKNIMLSDFPCELLNFIGVEFNVVATAFSGGCDTFKDSAKEIYYFGTKTFNLNVSELQPYKIVDGLVCDFEI